MKDFANSKDISIETDFADNLPEVNVDIDEISITVTIFIDNAITYSQKGGKVIITVKSDKHNLLTSITDNGSGIPEHMKYLIFKRYEMAVENERKIGAGINLYLAKQIVDAHRGKVFFSSEIGKGTTFTFSLPV